MKKVILIRLVIIVAVVFATTLVFAEKEGEAKVTITLMRDAAEMPDEVIQKFEEQNPDINVNIVENDPAKLMTMMAGGTAPDIFRFHLEDRSQQGIGIP